MEDTTVSDTSVSYLNILLERGVNGNLTAGHFVCVEKFRYFSVLLLICLLIIDHTESRVRRRLGRNRRNARNDGNGGNRRIASNVRNRRVPANFRRAASVLENSFTALDFATTIIDLVGTAEEFSKRSAENAIPDIDICKVNMLDLNDDNNITKEELAILIQSTGREELGELFENLDKNNDDIVTQDEYTNLYEDACKGNLKGADNQQKGESNVKEDDQPEDTN
ncbi:uncharacterized protein LOC133195239 [Saccostrea echinata]|uniref:uncharacterized protein LOC133195239 n=1 Tax=Saccostrea echinata TaxID=191078 RepID=UPI002A83BD80|nr:uncharacterized protein LOC133195239 [Saccostrea echinata]